MPRTLTKSEINYLHQLIQRNKKTIKDIDLNTGFETVIGNKWSESFEKPQTPKERMMRMRLRKKAEQMLIDLSLLSAAGIISYDFLKEFNKESLNRLDESLNDNPDYLTSKLYKDKY